MVNEINIPVVADSDDPAMAAVAASLAAELRVPFHDRGSHTSNPDFVLALGDEGLELRDQSTRPGRGLWVDFSTLHPRQAARRGGFSHHQPLARALGKDTRTVLDATAGLGHDSALLACIGYHVHAVERSPIIFALLRDGLRRAMADPDLHERLNGHLTIACADAREVLRAIEPAPDAVYIDPMFPPKRKTSALAKKEIRLVRQVVGDDEDAAELVDEARRHARRVVVKRPTYAPLLAPAPTASIAGKLVRYDVYVQPELVARRSRS